MGIVISVIIVLAIAGFLAYKTCKSKSDDKLKWIGIALLVSILFSWIFKSGYFNAGEFYDQGLKTVGITDVSAILYFAISFNITIIIYLLLLGGMYGILAKTKGYDALVNKFAKSINGKEILVAIIMMVVIIGLTSITTSALAIVLFMPFLISVLLKAKFDKTSAMGLTFGSILVGQLAATFGTDGLVAFNGYLGTDASVGLKYRVIFAIITLVLFVVYNILHLKRQSFNTKNSAEDEDLFAVQSVKGKLWPTIVVLSFLFVMTVLGFVDWSGSFNIECFNKFHTWLIGLTIGNDFTIMSSLLGSYAVAFGGFQITTLIVVVLIASILAAVLSELKFKDACVAFGDGFKKMFKPTVFYVIASTVFIVAYLSPFMASISNWILGLTKKFNPYTNALVGLISSIFHADLGYTGYIVGGLLTTSYTADLSLAHTLYVATYGLAQVFMPTTSLLVLGLTYLNLDYKSWFKYIWLFAAAMLVVLLVFATIICYI